MPEIDIQPVGDDGPPYNFKVEVAEKDGSTLHDVTLDDGTYREHSNGEVPPDRFVEACFEFLLDREPKEAILASFNVQIIGKYFSDFEEEIGGYL